MGSVKQDPIHDATCNPNCISLGNLSTSFVSSASTLSDISNFIILSKSQAHLCWFKSMKIYPLFVSESSSCRKKRTFPLVLKCNANDSGRVMRLLRCNVSEMRLLTPSGVNDSSFIVSIENVETKVSHASNDPPVQTSSSRWQKAKKVDVPCALRIRFPNNCNDASSANWISSIKSTVGFEWDEMTRISSPSMYLILSAESTQHAYVLNSIQLDGMSLLRRGTTSRSID